MPATQGPPLALFENERTTYRMTLKNKSTGEFDLTTALTVTSSNPDQVAVELITPDDGSAARRFRVLTPAEGAYTSRITVKASGYSDWAFDVTVKSIADGDMIGEPEAAESDE